MWGVAFKLETDDMREAPALAFIDNIVSAGAAIKVYDPVTIDECMRRVGDKVIYVQNMYDAVFDADTLFLVTEWKQFKMPSWRELQKTMKHCVAIDNVYAAKELREMGVDYMCKVDKREKSNLPNEKQIIQ